MEQQESPSCPEEFVVQREIVSGQDDDDGRSEKGCGGGGTQRGEAWSDKETSPKASFFQHLSQCERATDSSSCIYIAQTLFSELKAMLDPTLLPSEPCASEQDRLTS